jgi:hypothetical protein
MAISRTSRNTINTFSRFDNTSAGITSSAGEFILVQGNSTGAFSSDGVTWTTFTFSGIGNNSVDAIIYNPNTQQWIAWDSAAVAVFPRRSQIANVGFFWSSGVQPTGQFSNYKVLGIADYWGSNGTTWAEIDARHTYGYVARNTSYTNRGNSSIAWDGANTWAICATNGHWFYAVNTNNSPYPPGTNTFSTPWTSFTGPSGVTGTQFRDISFFNGAWHVSATTGVFRSVSLASPSWTQTSSVSNSQLFFANGLMWSLGWNNSVSTIYSTADGVTWNTITLPSAKARQTISFGNGIFVIANSDGTVTTSTTGASGSWTDRSTGLTGKVNASPVLAFGAA